MEKIVVDLLGADRGQEELALGALRVLEDTDISLVLVGEEEKIRPVIMEKYSTKMEKYSTKVEIIDARFTIGNDEAPTAVMSDKGLSSVSLAYAALKDEDAVALVSAGSTGAVLVGGMFKLGLIDGVKRPCLAAAILNCDGGKIYIADCGANLDCKSSTLLSFARLGTALAQSDAGYARPKVGLLSVGREDKKGNLVTKEAFAELKNSDLNFVGNVEGYDVLGNVADVLVCDGFYGNIVLKNCEAVGKLAVAKMREKLPAESKALDDIYKFFDYNGQGGATLLGLNKVVVKAHGAADGDTMVSCIKQAYRLSRNGLVENIKRLNKNA